MPDPRHEHGSRVAPVGDYAPGSHAVNPAGLSKGVVAVHPDHVPPPPSPPRQRPKKPPPDAARTRRPREVSDGPSEPQ